MASLTIERLREDLEPFQRELMEEFYQNYAGLKDETATVRIYETNGNVETATQAYLWIAPKTGTLPTNSSQDGIDAERKVATRLPWAGRSSRRER